MKSVAKLLFIILTFSLLGFGAPGTRALFSKDLLPKPGFPDHSVVRNFLGSIHVEAPEQYGGLTLFPLTTRGIDSSHYLTLEEALKTGSLDVRESGYGQVNQVELRNNSGQYIFAMSGEILEGAKQDRFLQQDLLLPPKTGWISVAVFCTEHGRWSEGASKFSSSNYIVPEEERKAAKMTSSQQEVWSSADRAMGALHVYAPTSNAKETYQAPQVKRQMASYEVRLKGIPFRKSHVVGVAAARGNELIVIDIFQSPEIFQKLYPKLLKSYITDVLSNSSDLEGRVITSNDILSYIRNARDGYIERTSTSGAGQALVIKGNHETGTALAFENYVIHLDLFPGTSEKSYEPEMTPDQLNLEYRRQQHR